MCTMLYSADVYNLFVQLCNQRYCLVDGANIPIVSERLWKNNVRTAAIQGEQQQRMLGRVGKHGVFHSDSY